MLYFVARGILVVLGVVWLVVVMGRFVCQHVPAPEGGLHSPHCGAVSHTPRCATATPASFILWVDVVDACLLETPHMCCEVLIDRPHLVMPMTLLSSSFLHTYMTSTAHAVRHSALRLVFRPL